MTENRVILLRFVLCYLLSVVSISAQAEVHSYSSGTGFFVTRGGYVVTNYHVVQHCMEAITLSGAVAPSKARLVAQDAEYDLALLQAGVSARDEAELSTVKQPLHAGDPVVIVGYPGTVGQNGQPRTSEAQILSARGPRGEEKWLKFSNALARGNSGGPLLDGSGNVVGVVAAKGKLVSVDAAGAREELETFDLAVSLPVLRRFLESSGVAYREADSGVQLSSGHITSDARRFVVNVTCRVK